MSGCNDVWAMWTKNLVFECMQIKKKHGFQRMILIVEIFAVVKYFGF